MHTCLINGLNLGDWYQIGRDEANKYMPVGLASLGAVLENSGFEASIIDFNYDIEDGALKTGDNLFADATDMIIEKNPDIVGFTSMCNSYYRTLSIAKELKRKSPDTPIILGGPQASIVDEETLSEFPFIDLILRGEAERTLPLLVRALQDGTDITEISGLSYRDNGNVIRNPDPPLIENLDELPIPAYHLFPFDIESAAILDAGRGCPFNCNFCCTSKYWHRSPRLKSIDRIIEEMTLLNSEYNVTHFSLLHDMLTVNREWINGLCERINGLEPDINWACSARPDCVDPQLLKTMADSGCDGIYFGVETGSPRMQTKTGKKLDLTQVVPNIETGLEAGIRTVVSFITGFPEETVEDVRQTLDLALKISSHNDAIIQLHILAPVKNTVYFDRYYDSLRFDGNFSDFVATGPNCPDSDWLIKHPDLFSTYYYFENDALPRNLMIDIDKFTNVICGVMSRSLQPQTGQGFDIWGLYLKWKQRHDQPSHKTAEDTPFDLFVIELYDYLCHLEENSIIEFNTEQARDDILQLYFNHYHRIRVMPKEFPDAADTTTNNSEEGVTLSHSQT